MATEKKIENQIKTFMRDELGAYVVKYHGNRFSQAGVPDILACWNMLFIGIEVKAPGEEPTPLQKHNIKQIIKAGGIAFVAESLEQVKENLGV